MVRTDLEYAEDIFDEIGEPLLHKMAIFEAVLIDGNHTSVPRQFNKTVKVASEGDYSTYFLFAPVKKVEASHISLDNTADSDDDDFLTSFFGSFFSSSDGLFPLDFDGWRL